VHGRLDLVADRRTAVGGLGTMVSRRRSASCRVFACSVVSEPSWPVFIACSISSASAPRHSPTTIRSGRMRSAFFTRSRIV
jgi:hypothetical protein